jgi:rhodanese-related sulfurtransferase
MVRKILLSIALVALVPLLAGAGDINWISKDSLRSALDDPGLTVIDVRQGGDWEQSDTKIKGAVRQDPGELEEWAAGYARDARLVLY